MSSPKLELSAFLLAYNLPLDALDVSGLNWPSLELIYDLHFKSISQLRFAANYIADVLQQLPEIHALKIRIKDPEHLIEKIIRKRLADRSRDITPENYREQITDLIGIRALHLFKQDWCNIHDLIVSTWRLSETPIAYVRKGDPEEIIKLFEDKSCRVEVHKLGYRSVHYLIRSQPSRELHIAELQVRTIFEEGWSEIDHRIRYPYHQDSKVLLQYSRILNGIAGNADEMGSFISLLRHGEGED